MENVRTNKTLLGVINETAKQAVYGTAEVGSQLTQEAVPAAKCIIRTTGKVVHQTGEVVLRGTFTLTNYMKQAQSASYVSSTLGINADYETLKSANSLPNGVTTLDEYRKYRDEQINY